MKELFVVIGFKNTKSNHSYIVGVYDNKDTAIRASEIELKNRGGNYRFITTRSVLNELPELIEEYEEPVQGINFTQINPMDLAFTVEELEGLKKI